MPLNLGQIPTEVNLGSLSTGARLYIWDSTQTGIERSRHTTWGSLQGFLGGASVIDDLTDVTITAASDLEMMRYDNGTSQWINETPEVFGLSKAPLLNRARRITGTTINGSGQYTQVVYNNGVTYDFTYNFDGTIDTKSDSTTTWQAVYSSGDFTNWDII